MFPALITWLAHANNQGDNSEEKYGQLIQGFLIGLLNFEIAKVKPEESRKSVNSTTMNGFANSSSRVSRDTMRRITRHLLYYFSAERTVEENLPPYRAPVLSKSSPGASHPCVSCGACCAYYRASFPFFEVKERGIPEDMVEEINFPYVAMKGTHQCKPVRCTALKGTIGAFGTTCSIYEVRASACRDFWPTLEDGSTRNEKCDKARLAHGMVPLSTHDWAAFSNETHKDMVFEAKAKDLLF